LRFGLNFQKAIGPQGGPGAGGGGTGRPAGAGQGGRPGGGGGGGGFGRFGGPGKRVSASLLYTHELTDEIRIAPGLPVLDLLNGGTTGNNGGTSRHRVDLEGGWFNNGLGIRAIAAWQSGSTVNGSATAQPLRFGSIGTLNLRFFLNFDQRKKLIEDVPFLKGSRIAIRIDNAFDQIRDVRDGTGAVPFRYQPGYVDPLGRTIEVSFRKLF
jgi:iron complex outermembrane recepter protein